MKKSNVLVIILSILVVVMGAYLIYDKVIVSKDKKSGNESINSKQNQKLDINSDLVKELYNKADITLLINDDGSIFNKLKKGEKVSTKDFKSEVKNELGFLNLSAGQLYSVSCADYIENLEYGDVCTAGYVDGPASKDDYNWFSSTIAFDEEDLKKSVEDIFGIDTYDRINKFSDSISSYYKIVKDEFTNDYRYIRIAFAGGGSGPKVVTKLIEAEKVKDELYIVQNYYLEDASGKYDEMNIKYTFNLVDGNYYFYSVEKVA